MYLPIHSHDRAERAIRRVSVDRLAHRQQDLLLELLVIILLLRLNILLFSASFPSGHSLQEAAQHVFPNRQDEKVASELSNHGLYLQASLQSPVALIESDARQSV